MLGSFTNGIASGPFGQAAEAWNESKWDAETVDASSNAGQPEQVDPATFVKHYWLPMAGVAVALWLLEKRRIAGGAGIKAGPIKVGASA